jgi:hypothetical protein
MHPGDAAKVLIIGLCLTFLGAVALHAAGRLDVFARSYVAAGFCLQNENEGGRAALHGHALAGYFDAAGALLMLGLVRAGRRRFGLSEAAVAPIAKNAVSLFAHGGAHIFLAATAGGGGGGTLDGLAGPQRLAAFAALLPVWFCFMRDRRRSARATLAFAAAHNFVQLFCLPARFFFTHVLMAVLLSSAVRWLRRPLAEKTLYYTLESWLVDVPIVLMSFVEALGCDAFLMGAGGHVWFDMVVPVMFAVYFALLVATGDGARGGAGGTPPLPAAVISAKESGVPAGVSTVPAASKGDRQPISPLLTSRRSAF